MPRVVVVGGGFGGLLATRGLNRSDLQVTLVDRQNYFLFQPLAYQVATGSLASVEIALPLRQALRRRSNVHVVLGEAAAFDLDARTVTVRDLANGGDETLTYDVLAVAAGAQYSYFGHEEWAEHAHELKTLEGALDLRDEILLAFEAADVEPDEARRAAWLTFVVVGAGPTGVEMAGQIAELARDALPQEFRVIDTRRARVLLVEAGPRVLASYSKRLSASAARQLRSLGVEPLLGTSVVGVDADGVEVESGGERRRIEARTKIWAAGVAASPLAGLLASAAGAETDRAGRVVVSRELTLPGHPDVFAFGDMAAVEGMPLPGIAPVAMQQGRHVARSIRDGSRTPFVYRDKGELATIGQSLAVGVVKRVPVTGFVAWALWLGVHIFYLVGFENRVLVLTRWAFAYVTRGRNARVIHRR
ncbi:MAG TPA: NAD(P)/FAD-dependent oxidoreductase [Gaiellaceae bacterium]|nr:NAD(P)/FAD-dependent oxidoreductase [Gaiellaceae bacterium]